MNELQTSEFDYSLLNNELAEKIKEKDYILTGLHSKYSKEVGKVLYEAQQEFSDYNNGGMFEEWYISRGFKKRNVYNYIQIYNEVQNLHGEQLEVFEKLPKSLQIETSKKSVDPELKQKVLDGDITTHKEYKQLESKWKQAEKQAEIERKERERLEQENEQLANVEPKVIKEEVIPDSVKKKIIERDKEILEANMKIGEMQSKLDMIKKQQKYENDEEKHEKELKALSYEANKSVLKTKLQIDEFLKEVAVTSYRRGAIASSSQGTKDKLQEGMDDLKNFIKEMEMALHGTIENIQ